MIKLRLLTGKNGASYKLVEQAVIPDIESINELGIVVKSIGKMLKPYIDSLGNPSIVTSCLNGSIENWIPADIQSIQAELVESNYRLVITNEDETADGEVNGKYEYVLIDSAYQDKFFPNEEVVYSNEVTDRSVIEVYTKLLNEMNLFRADRFESSLVINLLDAMNESVNLLGAINPYSVMKLTDVMRLLNKEIIVITK